MGYIQDTELVSSTEKLSPNQKAYRKRKTMGLCTNSGCPNPSEVNRTKCKSHLEESANRSKQITAEKKLKGICAWSCCKSNASLNKNFVFKTLCSKHLEELNRRNKERAKRRKAMGLCRQCGEPSMFGLVVCTVCQPRKTSLPPISIRKELKHHRQLEEKTRQKVEAQKRLEFLMEYLPLLENNRQREIALKRLWEQRTLENIAQDYRVTRERIRQIENQIVDIIASAVDEPNIPIPKIEKLCSLRQTEIQSVSYA